MRLTRAGSKAKRASAAGCAWQGCRPLRSACLPLPLTLCMYCSPADVERLSQLAQDPRPLEAKQVRPGSLVHCLAGLCSCLDMAAARQLGSC